MATAWQTLEEAALTLGISSRTLHRRITKGEVETRLNNGRREVMVSVPDTDAAPAGHRHGASASESTDANYAIGAPGALHDPLSDDGGQTMLALHEDRIRRSDLAIVAYQQSLTVAAAQMRRSRVGSRLAWSMAGGLAVALFLSVVYATHSVTRAHAEVETLTAQVKIASVMADNNARDAETFRRQAEQARIEAAHAQGELSASQLSAKQGAATNANAAAAAKAPTTRPLSAKGMLKAIFDY